MASDDDNDNPDSEAESDTPAPARRIVDVQLDDGDDDWEDLATQGLGTSTQTHRSRNPGKPRIPLKQHRRVAGGKNAHASALKRRNAKTSKMHRLGGDLDAIDAELVEHTERLATKYSMKPKEVRRRLLASSSYKPQRKPSLYNAKISVVMAELNTGKLSFFFFFAESTHLDML
jgi:hypothetical protein